MWIVYILQSCKKERFYIGITENIESRLEQHNNGRTKSTKPYKPWKLIYAEKFVDKQLGYKREYYLKHPKGYLEKKKIVEKHKLNLGEVA